MTEELLARIEERQQVGGDAGLDVAMLIAEVRRLRRDREILRVWWIDAFGGGLGKLIRIRRDDDEPVYAKDVLE